MKVSSDALLNNLKEITLRNIDEANKFGGLTMDKLNARPSESQWSILECIEHLNLYGDFYIPEIARVVSNNTHPGSEDFKSTWLGNYFAKSMMPKEGKLNKMKTFKNMNPIHSSLDKKVLNKFIDQQKQTLDLLEKARNINLTKLKTSISISKMIKLRLGDTFRVLIHHNDRHVIQALNTLDR